MSPRQLAIVVPALLVAACQGMSIPSLPIIAPYRIDIQQGNLVTQDMVAKLQPGMTRGQVRFVLGTPLVTDIFHSDRWDYVYSYEKAGKLTEQRRIAAVFSGDKLVRIEGDVVPAAAKPAVPPAPGTAPAPATDKPAASAPEAGAASSPAAATAVPGARP
jgi:outer membrane protein assembly factor BamE